MDNQEQAMSPRPETIQAQQTYTFPDAIRELLTSKKITRLSWNDVEEFGVFQDDYLTIHTKGKYHQWVVNSGDLEATDWVVVNE